MVLAALLPANSIAAADDASFDSDGFRTQRYRTPVTAPPSPATKIALSAALELRPDRDALFLDVMPAEGGVREKPGGGWRLSQRHETLPGARWYPETGRSPVDPVLWNALLASARTVGKPVIVFCRADCWMSWNAARRLALAGVRDVYWLAEGTDGWHAAGKPLVDARPVVVPEHSH